MKQLGQMVLLVCAIAGFALSASAESGRDVQNKVTVYLSPGATEREAVLTVWMTNLNPVIGITLPFKFDTAGDSLRLDSAWIVGGRAASFMLMPPLYTPKGQTLLVNMISNPDSVTHKMPPVPLGEGPIMWFRVSTKGKFPMEKFQMGPIQLPPSNVLLFVENSYNTVNPVFELSRKSPPAWSDGRGKPSRKGSPN